MIPNSRSEGNAHIDPLNGNCLSISLFRNLQLRWHEQPLPLPTRRHPHRLLALLLLDCNGIPRERDEIAWKLWPGDELSVTRPRLRLSLHGLSECLPSFGDEDPWIVRDGTRIGWRSDAPCNVDAWGLDRAEQELRRQVEATPAAHRRRIAQLQAALTLYSGPLLPELDDAWLGDHRAHYETIYRRIGIALFDHLVAIGDRNEALVTARLLVLHDPSDESTHLRLIHLYIDNGDRDSAQRQFDICARELQLIGSSPSHETESLMSDVRLGRRIESPVRNGLVLAPPPCTLPPDDDGEFVDAQQRVSDLVSTLYRSRLVGVIGPCGSGKSRVTREAARMQLPLWNANRISLFWHDHDRHELTQDLVAVNPPSSVVVDNLKESLALTFGLPITASPRSSFDLIVERIGQREVALVLDNIDRHLGAWTILIGNLLASCRRLRIVYTACAPTRFPGESVWRVPLLGTIAADRTTAARVPSAYSTLERATPVASSEAVRLYCALGGRLPIPLPDRIPAASTIDGWIAEADGLPLAAQLLAKLSRSTACIPPDSALRNALWNAVGAAKGGSVTGQSVVGAASKYRDPSILGSIGPARHTSLSSAYAHSLVRLSSNAHLSLSILRTMPPPLTLRAVQSAHQFHAIATHPEEAATGVFADVFDRANAHLPITGDWIDGLIELEAASVITVSMREGQSTVYQIRDGIRRYLDLEAALGIPEV